MAEYEGFDLLETPEPEQPNEYGEYSCSGCGMDGELCLNRMNAEPGQPRCCTTCAFDTDAHQRPGAATEETRGGKDHG